MDKIIVVGMATIPEREKQLIMVLKSLHRQCDVIELAMNDYKSVPSWIKDFPRVKATLCTNKKGDANKFLNIGDYPNAYYFSCDDDIIYPWNYTKIYIRHIRKRKCLITVHGSDMPNREIKSYYSGRVFKCHCLAKCNAAFVDIAGSGVSGFDTAMLSIKYKDFKKANMADIFLSMKCAEQGIQRYSISHKKGWIQGGLNKGETIYDKHKNKDKVQTNLVNKFNWRQ